MAKEIQIKELSQEDVDSLIKDLAGEPLENFKEGFHVEKGNMRALPSKERIYYLISLDKTSYLLVGINPNPAPNFINISSFARIVSEPKGKAADCLRQLITEKLIPKCNSLMPRKKVISVRLTLGGYKVFQYLQKEDNLPKGIEMIIINEAYPYWSCQIHVKRFKKIKCGGSILIIPATDG